MQKIIKRLVALFLCLLILSTHFLWSREALPKVEYVFYDDPIDVVIPSTKKDLKTLDLCIESVRKNVKNVRRIIVVSAEPLTSKAEWFDEKLYPFNRYDLGLYIFNQDALAAREFALECPRSGWIFQQLLKLYAPFVIPSISSNVLIVDSDVVFFRPVKFLGKQGAGFYAFGSEHWEPYFSHMNRLLPGLKKNYPQYSGVAHHMLFQRSVLEDLFDMIESYHRVSTWQAICQCINPEEINGSSLSEYEIYFNFVFARSDQVKIRPLKWKNGKSVSKKARDQHRSSGFDYIAYHDYYRS